MNKMYLADGSSVNLPDQRLNKFMAMLTHRGIKSVKFDDTIVVASPSNIVRIQLGEGDEPDVQPEIVEPVVIPTVADREEDRTRDESESGEVESAPKKETQQDYQNRIIAEMTEKSNCAGNKHEGKEQIINFQDVMIKRKNAKGSLPSRRYFPVCSFCGLRQKYVKADSLTEEQKENAKLWTGVK